MNHEVYVWPDVETWQSGGSPLSGHFFWTRRGAERFARRLYEKVKDTPEIRRLIRVTRRDPVRRPCHHSNANECVDDGCWGTVPRT